MNGITESHKALLALQSVEELSLKKKRELQSLIPNPDEWACAKNSEVLLSVLGEKYKAEFLSKISSVEDIICKLNREGVNYVSIIDDEYPDQLREIYDPPLVLFCKGDVSVLKTRCIGVVGTRTPTRYGQKVCDSFAREFARSGLTVVSGFARGVDSIAHKAVVDSDAPTIAVFACGLDTCYPSENRGLHDAIIAHGGLIVTEYPLGVKPLQYHFPERNRIISGLSEGVFLPEATLKSGSLITARLAIEQGKDLFVVPGNINSPESEGTNKLLQEMPHAFVIAPEDVFDRLGVKQVKRETEVVELNMAETMIVDALHDREMHFEELLEISGLGAGELNTLLMNLQLNGIIEETGGNHYALA